MRVAVKMRIVKERKPSREEGGKRNNIQMMIVALGIVVGAEMEAKKEEGKEGPKMMETMIHSPLHRVLQTIKEPSLCKVKICILNNNTQCGVTCIKEILNNFIN